VWFFVSEFTCAANDFAHFVGAGDEFRARPQQHVTAGRG